MIVSAGILKWALRLYPPLFFQRVWVQQFDRDFMGAKVKIAKSVLNINYNKSIFGGSIYSASDPFYAILFDQIMQRKGYKVRVWLKSAQINYLKPGRSNLYFTIRLRDEDIDEACQALNTNGKFVKAYSMEIINKHGELCATVLNEVYIRNLHSGENRTIAY